MEKTKAWNWQEANRKVWLEPSGESYYLAHRWKEQGRRSILDLGCGLGRHSILFAQNGFKVAATDLSPDGVVYLKEWAAREKLPIRAETADMMSLPYADASFDCVFSYHVISHCDAKGIRRVIAEMDRVLRPGGELYCTLCSKDSRSFRDAGYPKIDANTVVKTDEGPEKGVPHFFVDLDDLLSLFSGFEIISVRHVDDCWFDGAKRKSAHYFLLARKAAG